MCRGYKCAILTLCQFNSNLDNHVVLAKYSSENENGAKVKGIQFQILRRF